MMFPKGLDPVGRACGLTYATEGVMSDVSQMLSGGAPGPGMILGLFFASGSR